MSATSMIDDGRTYIAAGHVLAFRMVPIEPMRAGIVTPPHHHPMAPRTPTESKRRTRLWCRFHAQLALQQWYSRYMLVLSRGKAHDGRVCNAARMWQQ